MHWSYNILICFDPTESSVLDSASKLPLNIYVLSILFIHLMSLFVSLLLNLLIFRAKSHLLGTRLHLQNEFKEPVDLLHASTRPCQASASGKDFKNDKAAANPDISQKDS